MIANAEQINETTLAETFPKVDRVAVIFGNGPSLLKTIGDAEKLIDSGAVSFGVNRIFLARKSLDYYVALDPACWKYNFSEILSLSASGLFISDRYWPRIADHRVKCFSLAPDPFFFATSLECQIGHGHTSVYPCMQLAYIAGCREIHMFGVDFSTDGETTHFYGNARRCDRSWKLGKKSVSIGIRKMQSLGASVSVHSHLFEMDKE